MPYKMQAINGWVWCTADTDGVASPFPRPMAHPLNPGYECPGPHEPMYTSASVVVIVTRCPGCGHQTGHYPSCKAASPEDRADWGPFIKGYDSHGYQIYEGDDEEIAD